MSGSDVKLLDEQDNVVRDAGSVVGKEDKLG